jgi:hypothetical protein
VRQLVVQQQRKHVDTTSPLARSIDRGSRLVAAVIAHYAFPDWSKPTRTAFTNATNALKSLRKAIAEDLQESQDLDEHQDLLADMRRIHETIHVYREMRAPSDDETLVDIVTSAGYSGVEQWVAVQVLRLLNELELALPDAAEVALRVLPASGVAVTTKDALVKKYHRYVTEVLAAKNAGRSKHPIKRRWKRRIERVWRRQLARWAKQFAGQTVVIRARV